MKKASLKLAVQTGESLLHKHIKGERDDKEGKQNPQTVWMSPKSQFF